MAEVILIVSVVLVILVLPIVLVTIILIAGHRARPAHPKDAVGHAIDGLLGLRKKASTHAPKREDTPRD